MIGRTGPGLAALTGAVCGAGWFLSLEPAGDLPCTGSGLGCALLSLLVVVPALVVVWALVGWGLLRLARFARAGLTAVAGTAGAVALLFISTFALRFVRVQLPEDSGVVVLALAGAGGYALAAVLGAGYGGRRDGTEHRGQDG
ncbi:hypothetical protein SAMN05216188_102498 [Lentzea xinjiangensis]|uniref:Uncharacterized protein n=1 Tax=Lentzea xinjiangensis TaxID=402600 RepID=A0A1H9EEM3_9PSEU|nr:hypothetical protein [Lentzea xinjiangensis]SEQ23458.1 hypothetical protein SAMN05216188_102498 [Lentzea xinjiangensis]